jgi:hypothetical protein
MTNRDFRACDAFVTIIAESINVHRGDLYVLNTDHTIVNRNTVQRDVDAIVDLNRGRGRLSTKTEGNDQGSRWNSDWSEVAVLISQVTIPDFVHDNADLNTFHNCFGLSGPNNTVRNQLDETFDAGTRHFLDKHRLSAAKAGHVAAHH